MTQYLIKTDYSTKEILSVVIAPVQKRPPKRLYYNHGGTVRGLFYSVWAGNETEAVEFFKEINNV